MAFGMAEILYQAFRSQGVFGSLSLVASESSPTVGEALQRAMAANHDLLLWIECPTLLPPGPDGPAELELTLRIMDVHTGKTFWYLGERITAPHGSPEDWTVHGESTGPPAGVLRMLRTIANDWVLIFRGNQ